MNNYQKKFSEQLAKVKTIEQLRKEDEIVDRMFKVTDYVYSHDADTIGETLLVRMGGSLTSIYAYLGQKSARTRAERDIAENILEQQKKALELAYINDGTGYKVTEARAKASEDLAEENNELVILEANKNQIETLADACKTTIMFIQSMLAIKKAEMHTSRQLNDNQG